MGHTSDKSLAAKAYRDRSRQITSHDEPIQMGEAESLCLQNRLRFYREELKTSACAVPSKLTAHCFYFFHGLSCGVRGHEWAQLPRRERKTCHWLVQVTHDTQRGSVLTLGGQ